MNGDFDINDLLLKSRPEQEKALFMEVMKCCRGKPTELVLGAAINLLITAIRGTSRTWPNAEQVLDSYHQFGKDVLRKHYDLVTGKVYSNQSFTQIIHAAHVQADDKIRG